MKILQINKFYYPDIGGIETVVKQYAEFSTDEHEATVLCVHKNFKLRTSFEEVNNVKVIRCSSFGTFFSMPVSLSFFFFLFRIKNRFDVLHFHEPFPLASIMSPFLRGRTKIVVTWHSDIIKQKLLKRIIEIFQAALCRKADLITTTSPNMKRFSSVISHFKKKVRILPLSIDTENKQSSNLDKGYILYLGRLSYYKGIDILLKAYERSKTNKKLLIIGDGDANIVQTIKSMKLNSSKTIEFINEFVSEEEKYEYIKKCSFLAFPSIEPSEAFGIIQLEAMLLGKPVINTNLSTGVPYVSKHKVTGITVAPKSIEELSSAIDELSFDNNLLSRLGENARERVMNNFSNRIIKKELLKIYVDL
ncbi:MAG: glycosyltransferase [Bacteroidota bacterium]